MSYKKDVDDLRESGSVKLIQELLKKTSKKFIGLILTLKIKLLPQSLSMVKSC